jgi:hypothetical protein
MPNPTNRSGGDGGALTPITLARFCKIGMKHRHRSAASQRETQNNNGDDLLHGSLLTVRAGISASSMSNRCGEQVVEPLTRSIERLLSRAPPTSAADLAATDSPRPDRPGRAQTRRHPCRSTAVGIRLARVMQEMGERLSSPRFCPKQWGPARGRSSMQCHATSVE